MNIVQIPLLNGFVTSPFRKKNIKYFIICLSYHVFLKMPFFCSCRICKINSKDGNGRFLSTKKTFKKHQEKEKASIDEIDEIETTETESSNESISSCNASKKREFEDDELSESDINSVNSSSDNDTPFSIPLILEDGSKG